MGKEKVKDVEVQDEEVQDEEIQIDEEIYNTIKTEIETPYLEKVKTLEEQIADLQSKLQVSNRKRTIVISNKKEVVEPQPKEEPVKNIFI